MKIPDDELLWFDDEEEFWWRGTPENPDVGEMPVTHKDKERRHNPRLHELSRYLDDNFDRIEPRIIEYLTQIQEIKIEHHPLSDISQDRELSDSTKWRVSWLELLDIERWDCYEAVCLFDRNDWIYVCVMVLMQGDVPIGVRGRYW